jgi:hypothetical protein
LLALHRNGFAPSTPFRSPGALTYPCRCEYLVHGRSPVFEPLTTSFWHTDAVRGPSSPTQNLMLSLMAAIWRMTFDRHAPISSEAFLEAPIDLVTDAVLTADESETGQ